MAGRRAHSEATRDQKRGDILRAAERLLELGATLPTVAGIAQAAGIAKGTVYLYFQSSEEIFAAIVLDGWAAVLAKLEAELASVRSARLAADLFPGSLAALIENNPRLMRLDAALPELKTRMSEPARAHFHDGLAARLAAAGTQLETLLELPSGRGIDILTRSHALARGLWQSFDGRASECDASGGTSRSFPAELRATLEEYWRGASA
jgi:TetR/AcrR family transcriptional regulator